MKTMADFLNTIYQVTFREKRKFTKVIKAKRYPKRHVRLRVVNNGK